MTIARNLRAVRGDFGAGPSSSKGDFTEKNAQRDVQTMLDRSGFSMEVDKHNVVFTADDGSTIDLPVILPSSWFRILLSKYRYLLQGGDDKDLVQQLTAFWECYRYVQPGHEVYKGDPSRLASTLPIILYGDEGRYLKKGNFMVCTIECALGSSPKKPKKCTCAEDPSLKRYGNVAGSGNLEKNMGHWASVASSQLVNDHGNEFLSKYLLFGAASQVYRKNRGLITLAFKVISNDLRGLHEEGLNISGSMFYAAVLGCKGDLKFHHQVGNLTRSYFNAGIKENHPICSLCLAGKDGYEFEDLSDEPRWAATEFQERPWLEAPCLTNIVFEDNKPEGLFRLDLFHCWKCGLGRDLVGSTAIALMHLGYFDNEDPECSNSLPNRMERAWSSFYLWTRATGKTPAIHYFTQNLFNAPNQRSFPWANVKGSDCTLMTQWVLFVVRLSQELRGPVNGVFENAIIEVCESAIALFGVLHSHPLWLDRVCGQRCQHLLMVMIRGYRFLAREAKTLNVVGYGLKPKIHALHHISREMKLQLGRKAPRILNPLVFSCEANESVVGHVARIARRVSARTVTTRVLERVGVRMKALIKKKKKGSLGFRAKRFQRAKRSNT